ncbi:MAG TPA: PIG-L family deacetylase [Egibacteraceae bacterium]|nr:PIG-L family deacetylase [Egibacteraceae bacterium]
MRVLAVGAHPDDLEILCGGTLARYVAEGHEVVMATVANGDLGSFVHQRAEIAGLRAEEARASAAIAGAELMTLGVPDGEVSAASPDQRRMVIDLVREARPDVIITHPPNDYMTDHNQASQLVFDTSFLATLPLLQTTHPHHGTVTPLLYMDTIAGLQFEPSEFVDITDHLETKLSMFAAHRTQLEWLRDHDDVDMLEQLRTVARFRGLQCGVQYAEGFRPCNVWLRATTRRLLP